MCSFAERCLQKGCFVHVKCQFRGKVLAEGVFCARKMCSFAERCLQKGCFVHVKCQFRGKVLAEGVFCAPKMPISRRQKSCAMGNGSKLVAFKEEKNVRFRM